MTDLWKKVALWIHPSDYPDLPDAQKFLFHVLEPEKKEPEKPSLKKLMWKGWKEGKDFDVSESYLDQAGLTPTDILKSMRDYERDPRVSRWKKTGGVELGKEKPGEEESEVVDLMLLQLKEKLLGMIKPKKANLKILPSFYKVPAHYILKHPLVIAENVLPEEVCGFKIAASKNTHLITYNLEDNYSNDNEWNHLDSCLDFFIVGYKMNGWNDMIQLLFLGSDGGAEIRVNEKVRSLILFGYDSSTRTLKWIGEPSKTFYNGKPDGIKDWKRVWDVLMKRKTVLSLGELAEKMYDNIEGREFEPEDLTIERMRRDLK